MCEIKKIGTMEGYEEVNRVYSQNGICPTLNTMQGGNRQPMFLECVRIKQATREGSAPCIIGGVADLNYPTSKTRRGRVVDNGMTSPIIATKVIPSVIEKFTWEIDGEIYLIRVRKLTPRECWRLMDFTDEDFEKAQAVNSNTQLYKQAGNSIVKNVLCEVLRPLFE